MSTLQPMQIGSPTVVAAVTATSSTKTLGDTRSEYLIIYNAGSNPAFVNSGGTTVSVTFPTTSTGQRGVICPPGALVTYRKNNANDTTIAAICDTGLTTTLYIQSGDGQ